jgi:FixJ family two-component response regulator
MTDKPPVSSTDRADVVPGVHVVDDDPSLLKATSRLLRGAGFRVEVFGSAEDFLRYRLHHPDTPGCVIVDLRLPGLGGLELQEHMIRQKDLLPVIILTGFGEVRDSVRALKHDAVDFLTKPVPADSLIEAVKRALAREAEAREKRRQQDELAARYQELTRREREVLALVARGLLNKQIAFELGTVERTIKAHRAKVMAKMKVNSLAELVRVADCLDEYFKKQG